MFSRQLSSESQNSCGWKGPLETIWSSLFQGSTTPRVKLFFSSDSEGTCCFSACAPCLVSCHWADRSGSVFFTPSRVYSAGEKNENSLHRVVARYTAPQVLQNKHILGQHVQRGWMPSDLLLSPMSSHLHTCMLTYNKWSLKASILHTAIQKAHLERKTFMHSPSQRNIPRDRQSSKTLDFSSDMLKSFTEKGCSTFTDKSQQEPELQKTKKRLRTDHSSDSLYI